MLYLEVETWPFGFHISHAREEVCWPIDLLRVLVVRCEISRWSQRLRKTLKPFGRGLDPCKIGIASWGKKVQFWAEYHISRIGESSKGEFNTWPIALVSHEFIRHPGRFWNHMWRPILPRKWAHREPTRAVGTPQATKVYLERARDLSRSFSPLFSYSKLFKTAKK